MHVLLKYSLFVLIVYIFWGCAPTQLKRYHKTTSNIDISHRSINNIKVYTKDGNLYILDYWVNDDSLMIIHGSGILLDFNRNLISTVKTNNISETNVKYFEIHHDEIAIIETNKMRNHKGKIASITIPGVSLALLSTYCLINPKACFGSCPTFYASYGGNWRLMAEGFSSSILPAFEDRDIDHLYLAENKNDTFSIKLTNEALETHVIKYVNLLAIPKDKNEKVFCSEHGKFYVATKLYKPISCESNKIDCLEEISHLDKIEHFTECDSKNLAKKEELFLKFNIDSLSKLGLVIGSRQTLLTTYLFYQGMAYSGRYYGYFASSIENGNTFLKNRFQKVWDKLGGIEIYLEDKSGIWRKIHEISEMGPIATDLHLIELPQKRTGVINIKIKMTKGLWRIDYASLASVKNIDEPCRIKPDNILKNNIEDKDAIRILGDTINYLVTFPGESYILNYKLDSTKNYEFFLETRGYYLEWMREEWLNEEDLRKVRFLFAFPGLYMRKSAKEFKKIESSMEESFWNSRYEIH